MKTLRIYILGFTVFLALGLIKVNAQVLHWNDYPWDGDFIVDCPNSDIKVLKGTLVQDFVIHLDKEGNWIKINGQYDKSEYIANTGEAFRVFGAITIVLTEDFCFNETLLFLGDRGTKMLAKTLNRYKDGVLTKDMLNIDCPK